MTTQKIIRIYKSRKEAETAIASAVQHGWNVDDFQVHDLRKGWSCWKVCCLGAIFLPLALLGKKQDECEYIVILSRATV
jgi:hypothetical protein